VAVECNSIRKDLSNTDSRLTGDSERDAEVNICAAGADMGDDGGGDRTEEDLYE